MLLRALFLTLLIAGAGPARGFANAMPAIEDPRNVSGDTGPILPGSKWLLIALGAAVVGLSGLLYVLPARALDDARREAAASVTERVLLLQEEDRRRIARELHDGAGQALTAARLHLAALRATVEDQQAVAQILAHLDEALEEIRRSTSALAPPALAELGLCKALERHCETFASASKLRVRCQVPDELPALAAHVEIACYRIVQEALHNAAQHAQAASAWVKLETNAGGLLLEIGDDGVGLGEETSGGFGLDSIRERARLLGGTVSLLEGAGPGERLRVALPIDWRPA